MNIENQKEYMEKIKKINEGKNLKYSIFTMGCQLNENDSEKLCGMLEEMNYSKTENINESDFIIFNTCCVRENAEDKLFGKLGEVKKLKEQKGTIIAICGCMMQEQHIVDKIKKITGKDVIFYEGDVCDKKLLEEIFNDNKIDAVIHFAGYKAVGESVKKPLMYYRNNIDSTLTLCEVMNEHNVKNIVFSSSATVYGTPKSLPIKENFDVTHATNPYGETKIMIERILNDLYVSDNTWNIALLRYFNPIGAHKSGLIGENPNDIPNNLMPYIVKVANKELKELSVFGNDYDTIDGTGVRDYIHVVDLAKGHIKALNWVLNNNGIDAFNLGTGNGYSVLELVHAFERVNGVKVKYEIKPRRAGDIATCYADPTRAKEELGWVATRGIDEMCRDTWNFAKTRMK